MRNLEEFELPVVSGGDHWGYETSGGSIDEGHVASYAASYQPFYSRSGFMDEVVITAARPIGQEKAERVIACVQYMTMAPGKGTKPCADSFKSLMTK